MYIRDVVTGRDLDDEVEWCKFGGMVWEERGRGFFYAAFPRPEKLEVMNERMITKDLYNP